MTETSSTDLAEGVAVPGQSYRVRGLGHARYGATLGLLLLALMVGYGAMGVWDRLVADAGTYRCPPDCGRPPNAVPVSNLPRYVSPDGEFSVAYPAPGSFYDVTAGPAGVTARMTTGDRGVLRLFGEPARGRGARQVVEDFIAKEFLNASVDYELPNAMVGYRLGYGVVINFQTPALSTRNDMRAVVIASVNNDLALFAVAEGPFRRFTLDFGPGPPSGANLEIAMDMGRYVDSFSWKGDAPE